VTAHEYYAYMRLHLRRLKEGVEDARQNEHYWFMGWGISAANARQ